MSAMTHPKVPHTRPRITSDEMHGRVREFMEDIRTRRSVRDFTSEPIPDEVLSLAIEAAASAPSGANMQPWKFVVVRDAELKRRIRIAAEDEEKLNYSGRMPEEWLRALAPLETDWRKEFLEIAPALIVVFKEDYGISDGKKVRHYYVNESVGIACGFLLAALHRAGLSTLTHTPSPMGFLRSVLNRPENEKAYLLIPVGYAAADCQVPDISRKSVSQVSVWM